MKKPLPIGIENFEKLITNNYYYADKTLFIKELLQKKGDVNLFTRPRRFGKTLNLSMLRYFFEDMLNGQKNQDNRALFAGLNIQREQELCEKYQGKYPVINLSLKSAKQPTFEMAYHCLREMLAYEYKRHLEVIHDKIPQNEMEKYMRFVQEKAERTEVNTAIQYLSSILKKESIFTGLNNLKIISVLDKTYGEYFGFTQREVNEMLCYYQREHKREEVRDWYDGYLFGICRGECLSYPCHP